MQAYIQALEAAGARTVPLIYNGDINVELTKVDKVNGVFYCGGSAIDDDYIAFGKKVYDKVKALNDKGQYLPIWGTCLGMQDLA